MKVLLFEDDQVHFENLQQRLDSVNDLSCELVRREDISSFLAALEQGETNFDFALIDIFHGPGGETKGFDAFEKLKKKFPHFPAFFYTSHARMEFIARAKAAGASGFLDRMELHSQPELMRALAEHLQKESESLPFFVSPALKESLFNEFLIREAQNPGSSAREKVKSGIRLSEEESQFLSLYCQGFSRSEILHRLNLGSKQDYQSILPALYGKLGLSSSIPSDRMKAIGPYLAAAIHYRLIPFPLNDPSEK